MIARILSKLKREVYLLFHRSLWGKRVQINGIPSIGNIKRLRLGCDVSFNERAYLQCVGGIIIGDCVTISHGVVILTSGLVVKDYPELCMTSMRKHQTAPVTIGDGVWLCANSMVMPGVKIASKVIVAAGSVVTKDCEKEGWLYGGVPAKPIKSLYIDNQK